MDGTHEGVTSTASAVLSDLETEIPTDARLTYIDGDTGTVYQRETLDGDDPVEESWVPVGGLSAPTGDGVPPSKVVGVTVTQTTSQQADGTVIPAFEVSWSAVPETDVLAYEVQWDLDGTTFATPYAKRVGGDILSVVVTEGIIGGLGYDFRVRATDLDALFGDWSDTVSATAYGDSVPPDMPTGIVVIPGYRLLGVTWDQATESDFAFHQVRYYDSTDPGTILAVIQTKSSHLIIDGLDPEIDYGVQIRTIDRSGNVQVFLVGLPVAVNYVTHPDAGYSEEVVGTPSLVGAADLAVGTLVAEFITTGLLNADVINAGTLRVGQPGTPVHIEVYDQFGNLMFEVTEDGLVSFDPTDPQKALWLYGDTIRFSEEYDGDVSTTQWSTAISSRGLNAAAILFGTEPGGHNRIANAGMELADFPTTTRTTKTWTITTDWDDATSQVNLNVSGSALTMTAV